MQYFDKQKNNPIVLLNFESPFLKFWDKTKLSQPDQVTQAKQAGGQWTVKPMLWSHPDCLDVFT